MPGTVFNSTTLGVHLYSIGQNPATIATGAIITNTTAGYAGNAVYGESTYAWNLYNYGTVSATQSGSTGINPVSYTHLTLPTILRV